MDEHCSIQVKHSGLFIQASKVPLSKFSVLMILIKVSESTIVLTGGRITLNLVTEYSGLETGGWEVFHSLSLSLSLPFLLSLSLSLPLSLSLSLSLPFANVNFIDSISRCQASSWQA